MDGQWTLETQGDPLGRVRNFIKVVWLKSDLQGMLITVDEGSAARALPRYITDVAAIDTINPFRPVMEMNAARLIPGILASHPGARIGVLLRPCELRAMVEIAKHTTLDLGRVLTISVDCLGTLPADEYQWRRERIQKGALTNETPDELAQEALKFARQGGIIPYRFRAACQVCASPAAKNADINLHVLGLPVRQKLILSVPNPKTAQALGLNDYASGVAEEAAILQRQRILSRMDERHARHLQSVNQSLGTLLPAGVDALIQQLEACGDCQACMQACPISSVDRPQRDEAGHYDQAGVMRWLVSCVGCGMCEQACPNHLPTAAIFAHIRQQLDALWSYTPGASVDEPLPFS
jgi:formate dehydrogenase subunit beta